MNSTHSPPPPEATEAEISTSSVSTGKTNIYSALGARALTRFSVSTHLETSKILGSIFAHFAILYHTNSKS